MKQAAVVLALICVVGVNAVEPQEQMKDAQEGLLSLMNMGMAAFQQAKKAVNEHAFQTGENIGERLAADQQKEEHSVETKMEAAKEGLKDSVQSGVSMLQQFEDNVQEVAGDESVQQKAQAAIAPIRANPQFDYFNQLLDTYGQKAGEMT